jgi:hypothetical protein
MICRSAELFMMTLLDVLLIIRAMRKCQNSIHLRSGYLMLGRGRGNKNRIVVSHTTVRCGAPYQRREIALRRDTYLLPYPATTSRAYTPFDLKHHLHVMRLAITKTFVLTMPSCNLDAYDEDTGGLSSVTPRRPVWAAAYFLHTTQVFRYGYANISSTHPLNLLLLCSTNRGHVFQFRQLHRWWCARQHNER